MRKFKAFDTASRAHALFLTANPTGNWEALRPKERKSWLAEAKISPPAQAALQAVLKEDEVLFRILKVNPATKGLVVTGFPSTYDLVIWNDPRGKVFDGWTVIPEEVHSDHFTWVNDFSATHTLFGYVKGNLTSTIYTSSLQALQHFLRAVPHTDFDKNDI